MERKTLKCSVPATFAIVLTVASMLVFVPGEWSQAQDNSTAVAVVAIKLPPPRLDGSVSVEKALSERRTVRTYKEGPLSLADVSQLVWAAQGITEPGRGLRTAPSPQAVYLLDTYVISGNVTDLPMGMYKYEPKEHSLIRISEADKKADLFKAVGQAPIKNAPVLIVFTGISEKSKRPGWMYLEAGAASENIHLQAIAIGLGTVTIAGFKDEDVRKALGLGPDRQPIYIMPVGKK
jgi:SagB-type dehydrogenase family enzyme